MPTRITEPVLPPDAFSMGDTFIGHSPEAARPYRDASMEAMRRREAGIPGQETAQAAPAAPSLPMLGVARAKLGNHLSLLRQKAAGLERFLSSPPIGIGGQPVSHLIEQHRQARGELQALQAEIERINSLDDDATRRLAYELGAR